MQAILSKKSGENLEEATGCVFMAFSTKVVTQGLFPFFWFHLIKISDQAKHLLFMKKYTLDAI